MSTCSTISHSNITTRTTASGVCLLVVYSAFISISSSSAGGAIYSSIPSTFSESTFTDCSAVGYDCGAVYASIGNFSMNRCCCARGCATRYSFFKSLPTSDCCSYVNATSWVQCCPNLTIDCSHPVELCCGYIFINSINSSHNREQELSSGLSLVCSNASSSMESSTFANCSQVYVIATWSSSDYFFVVDHCNFANNLNANSLVYSQQKMEFSDCIFTGNLNNSFYLLSECLIVSSFFSSVPSSTTCLVLSNCTATSTSTFKLPFVRIGLCQADNTFTPTLSSGFTGNLALSRVSFRVTSISLCVLLI